MFLQVSIHNSFSLALTCYLNDLGGSDVANGTETTAVRQDNGTYKLYGYKWFSSATDADISLTLARITNDKGQTTEVNN